MRLFGRQRIIAEDRVEISEKNGIRFLHLGGPAVQSAMRLRSPFALELEYTRAMLAFLLFCRNPARMALIGLGGGSIAKFIHRQLPESSLTAVEINPEVVAAARSYFYLPANDDRLQVVVGDGAEYVAGQETALDVLLVDGYDALRIVESLSSTAFYQACNRALTPGGVVVFNLWGSDRNFDVYRARIRAAFDDHVLALPAEKKGNIQLFAFKPPLPETELPELLVRARELEVHTGLEMPRFVERLRSCNPTEAARLLV